MSFDFMGKTAVVTGASRGIGRAIALELAASGAKIMLDPDKMNYGLKLAAGDAAVTATAAEAAVAMWVGAAATAMTGAGVVGWR